MTGTLSLHERRHAVPRKSTLFCPACGHESPVRGDWRVRSRREYLEYVCPDCARTIAVRPDGGDVPAIRRRPSARAVAAGARLLVTSARLWRATVTGGMLRGEPSRSGRA